MAFCTNCGAQNQETTQFCTGCGTRLGTAAPTPPPPPPFAGPVTPGTPPPAPWAGPPPATPYTPGFQPGVTYAQWPDRAVGYLIDSLIVGVVMGILYGVLAGVLAVATTGFGNENFAGGICCVMIVLSTLATLLVGIFNRVYLVSKRGSSIGQGVMKLKVVDANGNLLSFGTALLRLLAQVGLGLIPLGSILDLLWPLWDDKRQTLHDKAVSSFVIKQI